MDSRDSQSSSSVGMIYSSSSSSPGLMEFRLPFRREPSLSLSPSPSPNPSPSPSPSPKPKSKRKPKSMPTPKRKPKSMPTRKPKPKSSPKSKRKSKRKPKSMPTPKRKPKKKSKIKPKRKSTPKSVSLVSASPFSNVSNLSGSDTSIIVSDDDLSLSVDSSSSIELTPNERRDFMKEILKDKTNITCNFRKALYWLENERIPKKTKKGAKFLGSGSMGVIFAGCPDSECNKKIIVKVIKMPTEFEDDDSHPAHVEVNFLKEFRTLFERNITPHVTILFFDFQCNLKKSCHSALV